MVQYKEVTCLEHKRSPCFFRREPNRATQHQLNYELSLLHYNLRSLLPKLDNLQVECATAEPDIVCITESWLDATH